MRKLTDLVPFYSFTAHFPLWLISQDSIDNSFRFGTTLLIGRLLDTATEQEAVNGGEDSCFLLGRDIRSGLIVDARLLAHRAVSKASAADFSRRGREPIPKAFR
jgi:hypothetical protein